MPTPSLAGQTFAELYRGRRVLLIGATGFLGSVVLSMLMHELETLERLVVLVRKTPGQTAESRFAERVLPGIAFDPVRERFGDRLDALLAAKLQVVQGDISQPGLGLDEATQGDLASHGLDLILNCSGLVDFHAPLEQAYKINILGTRHLLDFARQTSSRLVHTSTCYVAGSRTGRVAESIVPGDFPRRAELPYMAFDAPQELADIELELDLLRQRSATLETRGRLTERAVTKFRETNGCDPSEAQLANALKRAQRDQLASEGVEAGRRRAAFWGWPNVYTYSKAIAEQLLQASDVPTCVVRPAIIESALAYPLPGWNQSATTSAPLVMLALAGFDRVPAGVDHVIDVVPVDQVAWAILAAGAATLAGVQEAVYQVGTSTANPLTMHRVVDLIGLYVHERALDEPDSSPARRWLAANREPRMVEATRFKRHTALVTSLTDHVTRLVEENLETVGHHRARAWLERLGDWAGDVRGEVDRAIALWDVFMPFSHDYTYRFETAHIQALAALLAPDASVVHFAPAAIDWRHYWIDVHIPGLRRWVLADTNPAKAVKAVAANTSLLARVEGAASRDGYRSALAYMVGDRPFALTYSALWAAAGQLAQALATVSLPEGPLGIVTAAETAWPIALLGALRAGRPVLLIRPRYLAEGPHRDLPPVGATAVLSMVAPTACELSSATGECVSLAWSPEASAPPLGLAAHAGHPTLAVMTETADGWAPSPPLDARTLADRLRAVGDAWELAERDTALVVLGELDDPESDAIALAVLGALYQQASLELIRAVDWAAASPGLAPTTLVLGAAAWQALPDDLGFLERVGRVLDCSPLAGHEGRDRLLAKGSRVLQVLWDRPGLALVAARQLEKAGEPPAFEALAPWRLKVAEGDDRLQLGSGGAETWQDTPWHACEVSGGFRLEGNGASGPDGRILAVLKATGRLERVTLWPALPGESGRRALVTPVLDGLASFQPLRRRLLESVRAHNAEAPLAERINRLGVTLAPPSDQPDELPEAVVWLDTRHKPRYDEAPDLEELLAEDRVLLAGRLGLDALDSALAPLREATLTFERLQAWERALLRAAREGDWPTQGLLQAFDQELARASQPAYRAARAAGAFYQRARDWAAEESPETPLLPEPVSEAVRRALGKASMALYHHGLDIQVLGGSYVPAGENFLVVANHASHLDGGLVKYAIGAWGDRLHTLAAKDYFFGTPARRLLAHHFTRLIPTDRQKVTSEWLRKAREVLALGDCVLIFPEGTRGTEDELQPFKASLGTLIRTARVPVLPIQIVGTREILPKGQFLPRGRRVTVHVGPPIPPSAWETVGSERGALGQDKAIAAYLQRAVEALPHGDFFWLPEWRVRRVPGAPAEVTP